MGELEVRIVRLEPMRVASLWGFGENPEERAFQKLDAWAKPLGLLEDAERHPIFGFNNPNPSAGSPNYGYEVWIKVDASLVPEGDVRVLDFPGGLYAVTECQVPSDDTSVIGATWMRLVAWREDSAYKCGSHQWMEKSVPVKGPGYLFALDLYLPIAE